MSNLPLFSLYFYIVFIVYMFLRGVRPLSVLRISGIALVTGFILSVVVVFIYRGTDYFSFILIGLYEMVAVCCMATLPVVVMIVERDKILGSVTPLGIILVNIAVNVTPPTYPIPAALTWLAELNPIDRAPWSTLSDLLLFYLPALIALVLIGKGPPGNALFRFLLGLWLTFVGVASIAGPGWQAVSEFSADSITQGIVSMLSILTSVHLLMLALKLAMAIIGRGHDSYAVSLARSIQVDTTRLPFALLVALFFWFAVQGIITLDMSDVSKTISALILAFVVAEIVEYQVALRAAKQQPGS